MTSKPAILAFESSCDESAVAIVDEDGRVLYEALDSQIALHQIYGGVVPEVASRAHFAVMDQLGQGALDFIRRSNTKIQRIAATQGPGLIGPLLVGSSYARGLAVGLGLPFSGVHHLRGHIASVLLNRETTLTLPQSAQEIFPAWVVLASGGHTQILRVTPDLAAETLADTADDAAGECFDKSAKLMGLPYPGGPQIENLAKQLEEKDKSLAESLAKDLPRPRSQEGFSFSGLKTAIRVKLEKNPELRTSAAFAWAIQESVVESLMNGLDRVLKTFPRERPTQLIFCGGVAANQRLRARLSNWCQRHGLKLVLPPLKYCTDNAAMIAAAAWVQAPALELESCVARSPL